MCIRALLQGTRRPESVVEASRQATLDRHAAGPPIGQWDPGPRGLAVHDSITVHGETTLTPYLARPHDQQLREHLARAKESDRPTFVLVVGTSCTGKTRTLYEAVAAVLPDWPLTAPHTDSDLARRLRDGIPAGTIVWLDEMQDRLTTTPDGITAAKAMLELLRSDVGPILFAGTIWPTNLAGIQARPDQGQAGGGAGAIRTLLTRAAVIQVPESFIAADLTWPTINDPRLRKAKDTAAQTEHPKHGRKITQVLAGGTQLMNRLYPPVGTHATEEFSPAARAILLTAGDLRRVGMPNPLPAWAIEGIAPGYLDPPNARPPEQWLPAALGEVTDAATRDDALTGTRTLDIHAEGIPALTPHWTTSPDGVPTLGYDLHDYLLQEHLTRHRQAPTRPTLWRTLADRAEALSHETLRTLSASAENRGLLTVAIQLYLAMEGTGSAFWDQEHVPRLLAVQGDEQSISELRLLADEGNTFSQQRLADLLATRSDDLALDELRTRCDHGDEAAQRALIRRWACLNDEHAEKELRLLADAGIPGALPALARLLFSKHQNEALDELRSRCEQGSREASVLFVSLLAQLADEESLRELRRLADEGRNEAIISLSSLLADRDLDESLSELRALAKVGSWRARLSLLRFLAKRGDAGALAELRRSAGLGSSDHRYWLDRVLALRSDDSSLAELRVRAEEGDLDANRELASTVDYRGGRHFYNAKLRYLDQLAESAAAGAEDCLNELIRISNGGPFRREAAVRWWWVVASAQPSGDVLGGMLSPGGPVTWRASGRDIHLSLRALGLARLRDYADHGDRFAINALSRLLSQWAIDGDEGALVELRTWARRYHGESQVQLVLALAQLQDVDALRRLTHEAVPNASLGLLAVYRAIHPSRLVRELDVEAEPVWSWFRSVSYTHL
ncbi:MAG TPA: hypothetical protein DCQ20_06360, partial [Nitrospira sp.]|nr:hypothetical protein [Nitrospira sp.]